MTIYAERRLTEKERSRIKTLSGDAITKFIALRLGTMEAVHIESLAYSSGIFYYENVPSRLIHRVRINCINGLSLFFDHSIRIDDGAFDRMTIGIATSPFSKTISFNFYRYEVKMLNRLYTMIEDYTSMSIEKFSNGGLSYW